VTAKKRISRIWRSAAARRLTELAGNGSSPKEAAKIVAERLLKGVLGPPTDLGELARQLGVREILPENIPFSGELRREDSALVLVYSTHLSGGRRRFTIAHELGHAVLVREGLKLPHRGGEVERVCDLLASEILMPAKSFSEAAVPVSISRIFALANQYEVSFSAAAVRCSDLFNASVFKVERGRIRWGFGRFKEGPVSRLDPQIGFRVSEAFDREKGSESIRFENAPWRLEWSPSRENGGILFLLCPSFAR
jgi:hypothetical protein